MLILILLTLIMLGCFLFGVALYTDYRGLGTRSAARNHAAVEDFVLQGHDVRAFLIFGRTRKVGMFLMVLTGPLLLLLVLGVIGSVFAGLNGEGW